MIEKSEDFWMHIHRLSAALDDAGITRDERVRHVLLQLEQLPPLVRRELLLELTQVAADVLDLQPLAVAAANRIEEPAVQARDAG